MVQSTAKYLGRYAQPEADLADAIDDDVEHLVVVPMLAESHDSIADLAPGLAGSRSLTIIVVNATDDRSDEEHRTNAAMLHDLGGRGRPWWRARAHGVEVLVIDRASAGRRLPAGEGVGLARRIGCDLALALIHRGRGRTRWIHTTDADVTLPHDYFPAAAPIDAAALCYPFWHQCDYERPEDRALALYEIALRYYVVALRSAGSVYGVHTIGSTLAIDADTYAHVRGIPRRQAGEDFYLVNKARKLGPVATPQSAALTIRSRPSTRAPFGTGPAVRRIQSRIEAGEPIPFYHPVGFALLRSWIHWLDDDDDFSRWPSLDPRLQRAAERIGAPAALERIAASTRLPEARRRRRRDWFDGFRTLKLVHALRDHELGTTDWRTALTAQGGPSHDLEDARRWLAERDGATP